MKLYAIIVCLVVAFGVNIHAAGNCLKNSTGFTIRANGGEALASRPESLLNWKGYKTIKNTKEACFRLGWPDILWVQVEKDGGSKVLRFSFLKEGSLTLHTDAAEVEHTGKPYEALIKKSITGFEIGPDGALKISGKLAGNIAGYISLKPVIPTKTLPAPGQKDGFQKVHKGGKGDCAFCVWAAALNLRDGTALTQKEVRRKIADYISTLPDQEIEKKLADYHEFQEASRVEGAGDTDYYKIMIGEDNEVLTDPDKIKYDFTTDPPKLLTKIKRVDNKADLIKLITVGLGADGSVYKADEFIMDYAMKALGLQFILYFSSGQRAIAAGVKESYSCPEQTSKHEFAVPMYFDSAQGHYELYSFVYHNQRYEYFSRADLAEYPQDLKSFISGFARACGRLEWSTP